MASPTGADQPSGEVPPSDFQAPELQPPQARVGVPYPGADRTWPRLAGPLLAALVVFLAAAPGLWRVPVLDRDEARFAQSTAQMLESGDLVDPRFQDMPRDKKPVGVNWLQAASVKLVSSTQARAIWAYRLPSLLGAMIAAAACAWGAQAFFRPWRAASAGLVLACGWLLTSEAFIAKADALLCGAVTLSMAAFAHIYADTRRGAVLGRWTRALFWLGLTLAVMVKGPVGPMVAVLAGATLWIADRKAPWARRMSWRWGLLFMLGIAGPWMAAITVSTDGRFWLQSLGGDVAAKLAGAQEGHRGLPGYYALLAPVLVFPAAALLPAALAYGWRYRREPAARFALAWIAPAWLLFELAPTKLPHYALPLYGGLALLAAGALGHPFGRIARWGGAGLSLLAATVLGAVVGVAAVRLGGTGAAPAAAGGGLLILAAGIAGAIAALAAAPGEDGGRRISWLCVAAALGIGGHAVLAGLLLPSLDPLWTSRAAAALVADRGLDPRNGVTPGPVATAGYAEPSLVFLLGSDTDLDDGDGAAQALEAGQPALVEARELKPFLDRLRRDRVAADRVGVVSGLDYSNGRRVMLGLWRRR